MNTQIVKANTGFEANPIAQKKMKMAGCTSEIPAQGGWRGGSDEIPKGGWRGGSDEIPKGGWRGGSDEIPKGGWRGDEIPKGGWRGGSDEIPKGGWRGGSDEIPKGGLRGDEIPKGGWRSYIKTDVYRTEDGAAFFEFGFEQVGNIVEIDILDMPSYGARDDNPHKTHRHSSERGCYKICFGDPSNSRDMYSAKKWAKEWSEHTWDYICTGKEFPNV